MEKTIQSIGVSANLLKPRAGATLERLHRQAAHLGFALVVSDEPTAHLLPGARLVSPEEFPRAIDLLLALGGDGSMLHAARLLQGADVPLLGVNLGSLGFLTTVADEDLECALDVVREGRHTTRERTVAECTLHAACDHQTRGPYRALNDVVVGWGESSRVVTLAVRADGVPVESYLCDGLILATPTGSTGHSLSANGPILHPESPVFVLNPICPHTLSNRALVVPDSTAIEIEVAHSKKCQLLVIDGQDSHQVGEGDVIRVRKAAQGVRVVHIPGYNYYALLRQKLHWRGSAI